MINNKKINKIVYGGDYNPEQWDKETMEEDMKLLNLAHMDIVTLNVFNWAMLQPDENTYDFSKLDEEIEVLSRCNKKICLATSTAAHPAWMAKKYPEILRVDFEGRKRKFGGRHNSCPNSEVYKKYARRLATQIAERYKDVENIVAWHISNEYGGRCYCENCEKAFRVWLKDKYKTLESLNKAWNTNFWGHTFYEWDEIVSPNMLSEHFEENRTMFQGISLDYARFSSDSLLACYKEECEAVKKITPDIQVTTNFMGFYKELDYYKWAKYMDFISWDNYPSNEDPYAKIAMNHDLMRGLKSGLPFILMEQTPSVSNWLTYNALKRPGVMRLWSYQAVAHGSDAVMFFQMRRSIGACEKYHGALIDHVGDENTRVFRECTALGKELELLEDKILGSRSQAKAAIVFDWDNWWAIEYSAGPTRDLKYVDEVLKYYQAFNKLNIAVDIISVEEDLSNYELVVAPVLYMVKGDYAGKIEKYVAQGGNFITTFFSGIVNENDLVVTGGYPGLLKEVLGIWVEEIDALPLGVENEIKWEDKTFPSTLLCDIMHCKKAMPLATYGKEFYAGTPVITKNSYGKGKAWYIGTSSTDDFFTAFVENICKQLGVESILNVSEGIEVTRRQKEGKQYTFILNHTEETKEITIDKTYVDLLNHTGYKQGEVLEIKGKDVIILESLDAVK